ncbi:MAG: methyl-accepting chemotaxis protein, partial [Pseudomonadota bacterium]
MSFKTTLTFLVLGLCAAVVALSGLRLNDAWQNQLKAQRNLDAVPQLLDIKTIVDTLAAERLYVYALTSSAQQVHDDTVGEVLGSFEVTDTVYENALTRQDADLKNAAMIAFEGYKSARVTALDAAKTSAFLRDPASGAAWLAAAKDFDGIFQSAAVEKAGNNPAIARLVEELGRLEGAVADDALELAGVLASRAYFSTASVAELTGHETRFTSASTRIAELTQTALPALAVPAADLAAALDAIYIMPRAEILTVGIDGGTFPDTAEPDAWLSRTHDTFAAIGAFRQAALAFVLDHERKGLAQAEQTFLISALIIGAGILGSVAVFFTVIFMVVRPLRKSVAMVKQLADGDVNFSLSGFTRRHELGALTNAIHALREAERQARADRAARMRTNEELIAAVDGVVSAAALGDFSQTIPHPDGDIDAGTEALVQGVTRLCEIVSGFACDVDRAVAAMSEGDLTYRIDQTYAGLFGDVTGGVSRSMTRVGEVVSDVQIAAGDINEAVAHISSRASDGSARAAQQAELVEESRAILSELSDNVTQSSKAAQDAAIAGQTVVEQTNASVDMIDQTVESMSRVEHSSKDISDIVDMIEDIAFQTNILALNASVEAARAGTSGSGFAVVAQEVRALARRVSEAASNIGELISTSVDHVRDAAGSVRDTNVKLRSIKDEITNVVASVQTIAAICEEQSAGAVSVASQFEDFNETAKTNAQVADQNRTTAADLAQSTHHMLSQVSFFHTEQSERPPLGQKDAA